MNDVKTDINLARAQEDEIPPCPAGAAATENAAQLAAMPAVLPGEVVKALKAHPTMAAKVIAAIERGLDAQSWFYSKGEKKWINEVDHKTQLAAAKLYIENVEGLPIQRVHTINEVREADPRAILRKSPAVRRAYRKMLDEAEAEAGHDVQQSGSPKQVTAPSGPTAGS